MWPSFVGSWLWALPPSTFGGSICRIAALENALLMTKGHDIIEQHRGSYESTRLPRDLRVTCLNVAQLRVVWLIATDAFKAQLADS